MVWNKLVRRLTSNSRSTRRPIQRAATKRALRVETLDKRTLLAADIGIIEGIVFTDRTLNGLTADDDRLSGVQVQLYKDTGDQAFDSNVDTLVGNATTAAAGSATPGQYRFIDPDGGGPELGLDPGNYFVFQPAAGGLEARTSSMITIDTGSVKVVDIDRFDETTIVGTRTADNANSTVTEFDTVTGTGVIGGERDIQINRQGAISSVAISIEPNATPPTLEFSSSQAPGTAIVQYDGADASMTLQPTGLFTAGTGQNFSQGETISGFQVRASAIPAVNGAAATDFQIVVHSGASQTSTATVQYPAGANPGPVEIFVPFSSFTGTADFGNVGAVELNIDLFATQDVTLSIVEVLAPEIETANIANVQQVSLGGEIFIDNGPNANRDNGTKEDGVEGTVQTPVSVQLFRANQNPATDTPVATVQTSDAITSDRFVYQFNDLDPGDYVVVVPNSNFAAGSPLFAHRASSPTPADPDNNVDGDNNGTLQAGVGLVSAPITLVSNEETGDGDTDPNVNPSVDFGVVPQVDLRVTKTLNPNAPTDLRAGGVAVFDIVVQNSNAAGNVVTAENVSFIDTLPTGLNNPQFVGLPAGATANPANGQQISANLGSLTAGQSVSFQVRADIAAAQFADLTNTAVVSTTSGVELPTDAASDPNEDGDTNNNTDIALVSLPRADLAITKTTITNPINAGAPLTYQIEVVNTETVVAGRDQVGRGIVVTDDLPSEVTFVPGSGSFTVGQGVFTEPTTAGGDLVVNVGNLAPGERAVFRFNVNVDDNSPTPITNTASVASDADPNATNDNSAVTDPVARLVDVSIAKTIQTGDTVVAGGVFTYEFLVTNIGPSQADNITVTDALDSRLTFVSFDPLLSSVTRTPGDNQNLSFNVGTLGRGATASFSVDVRLDSSATGTISNTAVVPQVTNEPNDVLGNNDSTIASPIGRDVNLTIDKTVAIVGDTTGRTTATPGEDELIYTITVANTGTSSAENVVVTDSLPPSLLGDVISINNFATGDNSSFDAANQVATVTFGTIPAGGNRSFTITTVTIDDEATATLTNTARVNDPTDGEITDQVDTSLQKDFDIVVTKQVNDADKTVNVTDTVTYTVTVTNEGPSSATGIILTDTIPTGLTPTSGGATISTPAGTLAGTVSGSNIVFPAFDLGDDEVATATLSFTVDADAPTSIRNDATLNNAALLALGENDQSNNAASDTITVVPIVDITVTKSVDQTTARVGDSLEYTIVVSNPAGPAVANGVQILDTLPANVNFVSAVDANGQAVNSTVAGGVRTFDIGSLAVGGSFELTINAQVGTGATGQLTNTVNVATSTTEQGPLTNTANAATAVALPTASITGVVFVDANNNNSFDAGEVLEDDVTVELTGTNSFGETVSAQQQTDANGRYTFDGLFAGNYNVQRVNRPAGLRDGGEELGTGATSPGSVDAVDNAIMQITLEQDDAAQAFNFGLLESAFSKRRFLASAGS